VSEPSAVTGVRLRHGAGPRDKPLPPDAIGRAPPPQTLRAPSRHQRLPPREMGSTAQSCSSRPAPSVGVYAVLSSQYSGYWLTSLSRGLRARFPGVARSRGSRSPRVSHFL
jgi:hypothetical protein